MIRRDCLFFCWFGLFLCGVLGCSNLEVSKVFSVEGNLPERVFFNERIYEERNLVYFIMENRAKNYSKLVSYNVLTDEISEPIFEMRENMGKIKDCVLNEQFLVFSGLEIRDGVFIQRIFSFDFDSRELTEVESFSLSYEDISPLHLSLFQSKIVWLRQDVEERVSTVFHYDLSSQVRSVIRRLPFTVEGFQQASFALCYEMGNVYFDHKRDDGSYFVVGVNALSGLEVSRLAVPHEVLLHYRILFNDEYRFFLLYGKMERSDLIYRMDLLNGNVQRIAGFLQQSVIRNDFLALVGDRVFYSVQMNVSGVIGDSYVEGYDLSSFGVERREDSFGVVASRGYLGYLGFTGGSPQGILFELFLQ